MYLLSENLLKETIIYIYIYIYIYIFKKSKNWSQELLLYDVSYIELFTRKIQMFIVEWFFVLTELFPISV